MSQRSQGLLRPVLSAGAADVARAVLLARAGHRLHRLRLQVERANQVVLAVGHVERVAAQGHALRIVERRLVERAVVLARLARAGDGDLLAVQVGDDDAVVRAVGDEEPIALGVGHAPCRGRRAGCRPSRLKRASSNRIGFSFSVFLALCLAMSFSIALSRTSKFPSPLALPTMFPSGSMRQRVGQELDAVALPDFHLGVVDDRVRDLVAEDRLADAFAIFFVFELGGVDADDHQLVFVLLFQLGQVGKGVDAVDAAEGPEVEEDDLALEVLELDGPGGVEPAGAAVELGGGVAGFPGRPPPRRAVAGLAGCQSRTRTITSPKQASTPAPVSHGRQLPRSVYICPLLRMRFGPVFRRSAAKVAVILRC